VPVLAGETAAGAQAKLKRLGLRATLTRATSDQPAGTLRLIYVRFPVTSQSQLGKIVQQSPLGGGKAPQNAQVLVFLGVRRQ
jgi:hypothetical protein